MATLRRTLATACMLCLFTLSGCSSRSRVTDADWLTYLQPHLGWRSVGGDSLSGLQDDAAVKPSHKIIIVEAAH